MTRMQFSELCMAILKVVSLSSITVILPAYISVVKDAETSTTLSFISSTERYIYPLVWINNVFFVRNIKDIITLQGQQVVSSAQLEY